MALTYSNPGQLGSQAPSFALLGTDGKIHRLVDFAECRALVVVFMCNHCPYVQAVQGRINALAQEYAAKGVALVAINSNDTAKYPDDNLDAMKKRAHEQGFVFPYLLDESQEVAKAYGAVCTPDYFVYEHNRRERHLGFVLRYQGRLDDNWKDEKSVRRRDLALALDAILAGKAPDPKQEPSMGCSIKWKS